MTSLAASAAAAGNRVDVGLFFAALDAWVEGRWDDLDPGPCLDPESPELLSFPPLTTLLDPGRESGQVRLLACSASTRLLGLETAAVQDRVDAIVGWPTFSKLVQEAGRVVTFG